MPGPTLKTLDELATHSTLRRSWTGQDFTPQEIEEMYDTFLELVGSLELVTTLVLGVELELFASLQEDQPHPSYAR